MTAAPVDRGVAILRRWAEAHPLALDLALLALVTSAAAALRLTLLGDIPYGLHPDEAQAGLDARRIIDTGQIGVYTESVLGQPAGHSYLTVPAIWLLADTVFAVRIAVALVALLAVPLLYVLVRISLGRAEAFFASALLAVSYWHLFYSRIAHWSITYGTVVLAVLLCVVMGMRSGRSRWFFGAGLLLGLGVYTYNVYPIAVIAVAIFLGIITFTHMRKEWRWWLPSLAIVAGAALLVATPMIVYVSDPDAFFWTHVDNYSEVGVVRSDEFRDEDPAGKAWLILKQSGTFAKAYTFDGQEDIVDGNGVRPVFDPLTLALLTTGAAAAFLRRREPLVIAAVCMLLIIPLPALLQRGSIMRQPVAAAPFAMIIAALPLAALWRAATERPERLRAFPAALAVLALAGVAALTVRGYFFDWRDHPIERFVYHSEITSASLYMRGLPEDTDVYFYSDRHPFNLETRLFLAPDVTGEDRSREFSDKDGSIARLDLHNAVSFVLLPGYFDLLPAIAERYPGGNVRAVKRGKVTEFIAYELPAP